MDTGKRQWFRRRRSSPTKPTEPTEPTPRVVRPDNNPDDENRSAVDVCFVFDTTGSMSNKIAGLTACMVDFVGELSELQLNWRITTVPYGDLTVSTDKIVSDLPFVRSYDDAVQQLRTMPRFSGGSNYGESTLDLSEAEVGEQITIKEAICFVASPDRPGYRRWADDNGGKWYKIDQAVDTTQILAYLRSLVRELPQVAQEVHDLGGGSVSRYLQAKGDPSRSNAVED
jgi:hypothetical protein